MPNHCLQQTAIHGPRESRDKFISLAVEDGYPSLKVLHPMPEELSGTFVGFTFEEYLAKKRAEEHAKLLLKYGHGDWYSWAHAEWGTKWGDYDTNIITHDEWATSIEYQSAWGPSSELRHYDHRRVSRLRRLHHPQGRQDTGRHRDRDTRV